MRTEFGIIIACGVLVAAIFTLILIDYDSVILVSGLERLNQQALDAKEHDDQNRLDLLKPQMQMHLMRVASSELGMSIDSTYLEKGWNFPFIDSSEVKPQLEKYETTPICNILPNLSLHLQNIRQTELFSMYDSKYQNYFLEMDVSDERYYNSTVHYGFTAKSGNQHASTFFHVDSCTGKTLDYFFIRCHDPVIGNSTSSNFPNEVIASLESDIFCEVHLEPWRQELAEYDEGISKEVDALLGKIQRQENHGSEKMDVIAKELHRLNLISDMVRLAMNGSSAGEEFEEKMNSYERSYGILPEDVLDLIGKRN